MSAGSISLWFYWQLSTSLQWHLVWPCLLAMGYVLPVLFAKKRLRDLNYLKIFLIALVWPWLTVFLPAAEQHMHFNLPVYLMCLERFFFIFAITLPFDIRDLEIDAHMDVKTIPGGIGVKKSKILASVLLLAMLACSSLNWILNAYNHWIMLAMILSAFSSFLLIMKSDRSKHDYYYTGLMDGTMILQGLLVWGANLF